MLLCLVGGAVVWKRLSPFAGRGHLPAGCPGGFFGRVRDMSKLAVIAVDVGGTTVDAACISAAGGLIGEVVESASPAAGTKDEIVSELARAVAAARAQARDFTVTGCGIAMPAPFDYAAGVSHMEHKFQAINGVNLGRLLVERTGLPTYFINDADAFGLGV